MLCYVQSQFLILLYWTICIIIVCGSPQISTNHHFPPKRLDFSESDPNNDQTFHALEICETKVLAGGFTNIFVFSPRNPRFRWTGLWPQNYHFFMDWKTLLAPTLSSPKQKTLTSLSSEKPVPGTVTPFYAWAKIAGCSSLGKYGAPKETEAKEHQILSLDAGYFVENHLGFLTAIFFCCVFFEAHPKKGP